MSHSPSLASPPLGAGPVRPGRTLTEPVATALSEAVQGLRFGTIQLTVHEGRVVQLDVTERRRF